MELARRLLYSPSPCTVRPKSLDDIPSGVHLSDHVVGYLKLDTVSAQHWRFDYDHRLLQARFPWTFDAAGNVLKDRPHMGYPYIRKKDSTTLDLNGYVLCGDPEYIALRKAQRDAEAAQPERSRFDKTRKRSLRASSSREPASKRRESDTGSEVESIPADMFSPRRRSPAERAAPATAVAATPSAASPTVSTLPAAAPAATASATTAPPATMALLEQRNWLVRELRNSKREHSLLKVENTKLQNKVEDLEYQLMTADAPDTQQMTTEDISKMSVLMQAALNIMTGVGEQQMSAAPKTAGGQEEIERSRKVMDPLCMQFYSTYMERVAQQGAEPQDGDENGPQNGLEVGGIDERGDTRTATEPY